MTTVTLTRVYTSEEKTGKTGKPYRQLNIQTEQHGEKWISGFQNQANKNWKAGDTVEVEIVENGKYLNYKLPQSKLPSKTWDKINELEKRLSKVESAVFKTKAELEDHFEDGAPVLDDLPF